MSVQVQPPILAFALPQFDSSSVLASFNSIAEDVHLPLEEVAYSLEGTNHVPYLQYRIMATTRTGYGEIRKFLAVISSEIPSATLDAIHCNRANAIDETLGCELAFSVFFNKPDHE